MRTTMPQVGDIALAAVLAVVGFVGTGFADHSSPLDRPVDSIALGLVTGCALVLVVRRRWPLPTLAAAALLTAAYLVWGYPYGPIFFPFIVAVYTAARHRPVRLSGPAAAGALMLLLTHLFTHRTALPGLLGVVPGAGWVIAPFALGLTVRLQREAVRRARSEAIRQRVDDERLRVAQEVHDVVGHGLAAIKMQADLALHLLTKKPEQAYTSLSAISRTSDVALQELRATLAAVRHTGSEEPDRAPAPGLDRLEDLRLRMHEVGLDVRVTTGGEPRALSQAADLAAYRVVQESLTNVLKHSPTKVAEVDVRHETDTVVITVSNPAPAPHPERTGLGIIGMRERVHALGGRFAAGPTPDGRFEVVAAIPTDGGA